MQKLTSANLNLPLSLSPNILPLLNNNSAVYVH